MGSQRRLEVVAKTLRISRLSRQSVNRGAAQTSTRNSGFHPYRVPVPLRRWTALFFLRDSSCFACLNPHGRLCHCKQPAAHGSVAFGSGGNFTCGRVRSRVFDVMRCHIRSAARVTLAKPKHTVNTGRHSYSSRRIAPRRHGTIHHVHG